MISAVQLLPSDLAGFSQMFVHLGLGLSDTFGGKAPDVAKSVLQGNAKCFPYPCLLGS